MRRNKNIGEDKMIDKIKNLDKKWWVVAFFVVAIVANLLGFGD